MCKANVTSKGQVTIPKEVREKLGIKPGDVLEFKETPIGYGIQRNVDPNMLDKYVGYLRTDNTASTDETIADLRDI